MKYGKFLLRLRGGTHSPLAEKLLKVIFSIYFCVALLTTLTQLVLQYKDELVKTRAEIDGMVALISPALSDALWNFNDKSALDTLRVLVKSNALVGVSLEGAIPIAVGEVLPIRGDAKGDEHRSGFDGRDLFPASRLYEASYPIKHTDRQGRETALGMLRIYSSTNVVLSRSTGAISAIIVSAIIKTIALWLILYFVVKIVVARPIEKLAIGLNRINGELPRNAMKSQQQLRHMTSQSDELGFLLRSFISMRRALKRSQRKLLAYQQDLEQKIFERTNELHHQATHDELTGLLNRRAFEAHMSSLMDASAPKPHVRNVLCFIDLDHFKLVNDTFGHAAGDDLLRQVADILRQNVRPTDIVARIGGDEFALVLSDCLIGEAQKKVEQLGREVSTLLLQKDGKRIAIGFSAGLVPFNSLPASNTTQMLTRADTACYSAKASGRNQVRIFDESAETPLRRMVDVNWVNLINLALREDRFLLYFQPLFASNGADGGKMKMMEILVRMEMDGEVISPGSFMPAAERYNLSAKIDFWVFSHVLEFLGKNRNILEALELVHINLSAPSISDAAFYRFAIQQLKKHDIPFNKICLEVTETSALSNLDYSVRVIEGLRKRGVLFALDDFGHGMSSFTYLQRLPVDIVKIDGQFVRNIMENSISCAIVNSVNEIAHMGGKRTVAEFVENEIIADKLRELKVDYLQGYHLGKPMPLQRLLTTPDIADQTVSDHSALPA